MNFDWHNNLTTHLLNFRQYGPGRFDTIKENGHGYVHHVHLHDRHKSVPPAHLCTPKYQNSDGDSFTPQPWPYDSPMPAGLPEPLPVQIQPDNTVNFFRLQLPISPARTMTDQGVRTIDVLV